jgi:hypothetical protein
VGEPAWSGLGPAQAAGRACVICTTRLATGHGVVVGRAAAGSPVVACAGVCAARATALAAFTSSCQTVGRGGQR